MMRSACGKRSRLANRGLSSSTETVKPRTLPIAASGWAMWPAPTMMSCGIAGSTSTKMSTSPPSIPTTEPPSGEDARLYTRDLRLVRASTAACVTARSSPSGRSPALRAESAKTALFERSRPRLSGDRRTCTIATPSSCCQSSASASASARLTVSDFIELTNCGPAWSEASVGNRRLRGLEPYRGCARAADTNERNGRLGNGRNAVKVPPAGMGEIGPASGRGGVLRPAVDLVKDGPGPGKAMCQRHTIASLPVDLVADDDSHRPQAVKDVELGHRKTREAGQAGRVAQCHGIQPANPARPSRRGAVLLTPFAEPRGLALCHLGGKRALTDGGSVGLHHAHHVRDVPWRDAKAWAGAGGKGGRGRDVGVGAPVKIAHHSELAFGQNSIISG